MVTRKQTEIFVVWGPDPEAKEDDSKQAILAVTSQENEAESTMGEVLFKAAESHVKALRSGGTCSVYLRRGSGGNDVLTGGRTFAEGSFAMTNPAGSDDHKRHTWEFHVERVALATRVGEEPMG